MSVIRYAAMKALGDYLTPLVQTQVPAMTGSVNLAGSRGDFADGLQYPGVVLVPGKFRYVPFQETLEDDSLADRALVCVGEMDGSVEVRAYATTPYLRRQLEEAVTEALLSTELAPGVVTLRMDPVPVGGTAWVSGSLCSFELNDTEWQDEMAFSSRRYSYLTLNCQVPALYMRTGVYSLDDLRILVSAAVTEDVSTSSFVSGSDTPFEMTNVSPSGSASSWYLDGQSP